MRTEARQVGLQGLSASHVRDALSVSDRSTTRKVSRTAARSLGSKCCPAAAAVLCRGLVAVCVSSGCGDKARLNAEDR